MPVYQQYCEIWLICNICGLKSSEEGYQGNNFKAAQQQAEQAGWSFKQDGSTVCCKCNGKSVKKEKTIDVLEIVHKYGS